MLSDKKILYVINGAAFFNRRLSTLARAAGELGYEVHVATPDCPEANLIPEMGFHFHQVPFSRSGVGPWSELNTFLRLESLYRRIKPSIVHHFTIKPTIYGGLAARRTKVPAVVSTITGLGFVFSSRHLKARILKPGLLPWFRMAMNQENFRVVFQNREDQTFFLHRGLVNKKRTALIHGTGVDISLFNPSEEPEGTPLVVFASRMLVEKGASQFVETAKTLRAQGVEARFALVGGPDPGYPRSIPRKRLQAWARGGEVEWWGTRADMPAILASSSLVCLPSRYGEGVPRILVEAAASARAAVSFDAPGCREIIRHNQTGLLVPLGNLEALAKAVKSLLGNREQRTNMGLRGRSLVEERFTQEKIIAQNLALYRELAP